MKSLESRQQEIFTSSNYLRVFPGGSAVKNLPVMQEGLIPGSGRSSAEGNGNPLQNSGLVNPMDRGAWWATVHGVARVGHDL